MATDLNCSWTTFNAITKWFTNSTLRLVKRIQKPIQYRNQCIQKRSLTFIVRHYSKLLLSNNSCSGSKLVALKRCPCEGTVKRGWNRVFLCNLSRLNCSIYNLALDLGVSESKGMAHRPQSNFPPVTIPMYRYYYIWHSKNCKLSMLIYLYLLHRNEVSTFYENRSSILHKRMVLIWSWKIMVFLDVWYHTNFEYRKKLKKMGTVKGHGGE